MREKLFLIIFFVAFIAVGFGAGVYGFYKLAEYNFAEKVNATVVAAEYENGDMDVTFSFVRNGETVFTEATIDGVKYENGLLPYYEGKQVEIRVNGKGEAVVFGKTQIIAIVCGVAFVAAGWGFLYFTVLRKRPFTDIAFDYEAAMVDPDGISDATGKYEAVADQLTKLPANSVERQFGEAGVWGRRIRDRFLTFSVWENIVFGALLIVPVILQCVVPLFYDKQVTIGYAISCALIWLFVYCFFGTVFKACYGLYLKVLVARGKFSERKLAVVESCAFESSLSFQSGEFSRTHTVYKKFRVVAKVDGKRSVGYAKGNIPPPRGAVIKVLIRPHKPKRWIIDKG